MPTTSVVLVRDMLLYATVMFTPLLFAPPALASWMKQFLMVTFFLFIASTPCAPLPLVSYVIFVPLQSRNMLSAPIVMHVPDEVRLALRIVLDVRVPQLEL